MLAPLIFRTKRIIMFWEHFLLSKLGFDLFSSSQSLSASKTPHILSQKFQNRPGKSGQIPKNAADILS